MAAAAEEEKCVPVQDGVLNLSCNTGDDDNPEECGVNVVRWRTMTVGCCGSSSIISIDNGLLQPIL